MFIMPIISASLAYINKHYAYTAQGAFCAMAIRPIWYRLALQWIPRYFVFVIVIVLCTIVYTHVGKQLGLFNTIWAVGEINPIREEMPFWDIVLRRSSDSTPASAQSVIFNHESNTERRASPPVINNPIRGPNIMRSPSNVGAATAQEVLISQRHQIILQLRMIFLYPIIFIALWTIPFVIHCLQYKDKYAANIPVWLFAIGVICVMAMGGTDSIVFLAREKPWRSRQLYPTWWPWCHEADYDADIGDEPPRSTSLMTARNTGQHENERDSRHTGFGTTRGSGSSTNSILSRTAFSSISTLPDTPRRYHSSSGNRRYRREAYARLAAERAERREELRGSVRGKTGSKTGMAKIQEHGVGEVREWWGNLAV